MVIYNIFSTIQINFISYMPCYLGNKCVDNTYATCYVSESDCDEIEVANDDVTFEICQKCSKL